MWYWRVQYVIHEGGICDSWLMIRGVRNALLLTYSQTLNR